ncbi:MAG TPA: hypothetical protein VFK36_12455 [Gemmatimonadales bacterium]|nr:hypothetical protein [Gemmatimonadales bacterium]
MMVEYITLNASAAKQVLQRWTAHITPGQVIVVGAALLLVWVVWKAFGARS